MTIVITKSVETLGLLALVSVVVIIASKSVGDSNIKAMPSPEFRAVRNITLATLIASSSFLALLGALSIWDVISDRYILNKSLSSLAIIAFASLIIVIVALEREQNHLWEKQNRKISGGVAVVVILFIWLLITLIYMNG